MSAAIVPFTVIKGGRRARARTPKNDELAKLIRGLGLLQRQRRSAIGVIDTLVQFYLNGRAGHEYGPSA